MKVASSCGKPTFGAAFEREAVDRDQAPVDGDLFVLGLDQRVEALDEVGELEEVAVEGERVGHHREAGRPIERQAAASTLRPRSAETGAAGVRWRPAPARVRRRRRLRPAAAALRNLTPDARRSGSAGPAAKRCRHRRAPPCRERPAAGSRPANSSRAARPRCDFASVLGKRCFNLVDFCSASFSASSRFGLSGASRRPRRARRRRASRRSGGWWISSRSSSQPSPERLRWRRRMRFRSVRRLRRGRFGCCGDRDRRRVEGDDQSNLAMKLRVRQSSCRRRLRRRRCRAGSPSFLLRAVPRTRHRLG